ILREGSGAARPARAASRGGPRRVALRLSGGRHRGGGGTDALLVDGFHPLRSRSRHLRPKRTGPPPPPLPVAHPGRRPDEAGLSGGAGTRPRGEGPGGPAVERIFRVKGAKALLWNRT